MVVVLVIVVDVFKFGVGGYVVIGLDMRRFCDMIKVVLVCGLMCSGLLVFDLGVVFMFGTVFIVRFSKVVFGVVIFVSHNLFMGCARWISLSRRWFC